MVKSSGEMNFEPADKVAFVKKMARQLAMSEDPELKLAARVLTQYLDVEGSDLDACLGLKPRQGGRYETPWRLAEDARREGMIRDLAMLVPGSVTARSMTLAAWIAAGGPPASADVCITEKYRELLSTFPTVPRSARQLARVIRGETVAARLTK